MFLLKLFIFLSKLFFSNSLFNKRRNTLEDRKYINSSVTPFKFFNKVANTLGFSLSHSSNGNYEFMRHSIVIGSILFENNNNTEQFLKDNIFFLITDKIVIREKFCRILLETKVEVMNDIFDSKDSLLIWQVQRDYSYKMEDDVNIVKYEFDNFVNSVKEKFVDIYDRFNKVADENVVKVEQLSNGKLKVIENKENKVSNFYKASIQLILQMN